MMIYTEQVFVRTESRENVETALRELLERSSFEFVETDLPPLKRHAVVDRRTVRHFYVGSPVYGWVCILEAWSGDEALAPALAERLRTSAVWFSFYSVSEEFKYAIYEGAKLVERQHFRPAEPTKKRILAFTGQRKPEPSEVQLFQAADEFYKKHGLPWPLYGYEQIDAHPDKAEYFHHLNFRRIDTPS